MFETTTQLMTPPRIVRFPTTGVLHSKNRQAVLSTNTRTGSDSRDLVPRNKSWDPVYSRVKPIVLLDLTSTLLDQRAA